MLAEGNAGKCALFAGRMGFYRLEFFDEGGRITAKAFGPVPFARPCGISHVASATGRDVEDAFRLIVERLRNDEA